MRLPIFKVCLVFGALAEARIQHIRVLPANSIPPYTYFEWDASGNLSKVSGSVPHYIDLIAQRFRLTYSWVQTGKRMPVDDTPTQKGLMTLLKENVGDMAMGIIIPSPARYRFVDFTNPVMEEPFAIIIPSPTAAVDNSALIKPFTKEVWIGIIVCQVTVVIFWHVITLVSDIIRNPRPLSNSNRTNETVYIPLSYTLTVLLTQGNDTRMRRLAVGLIAGAWCLAAFVLVPAYSGTLTSFLTSPIARPIVDSYRDIPDRVISAGMKVAVEGGLGVDIQLNLWANLSASGAMNTSIVKMAFAARNSIYRCNKTEKCIESVVQGGHIAITGETQALKLLRDDLLTSGTCRMSLAKETFSKGFATWIVAKKSAYLDLLNKGILEVDAFGLSKYWKNHYTPRVTACNNPAGQSTRNKKISLVYMSSTFVLFLVGCASGAAVFVCELVTKRR